VSAQRRTSVEPQPSSTWSGVTLWCFAIASAMRFLGDVGIAAGDRFRVCDGVARLVRRAVRIFVRINLDRAIRAALARAGAPRPAVPLFRAARALRRARAPGSAQIGAGSKLHHSSQPPRKATLTAAIIRPSHQGAQACRWRVGCTLCTKGTPSRRSQYWMRSDFSCQARNAAIASSRISCSMGMRRARAGLANSRKMIASSNPAAAASAADPP